MFSFLIICYTNVFVDSCKSLYTHDLAADKLAISGETGSLCIKNISDSTTENTIYVCYKNVSGDAYLGGIAYRAKIAGGMAPGAEQKISAAHFDSNSKIIFVSYGT